MIVSILHFFIISHFSSNSFYSAYAVNIVGPDSFSTSSVSIGSFDKSLNNLPSLDDCKTSPFFVIPKIHMSSFYSKPVPLLFKSGTFSLDESINKWHIISNITRLTPCLWNCIFFKIWFKLELENQPLCITQNTKFSTLLLLHSMLLI